jgi:purine-nucleoside phosphorylase
VYSKILEAADFIRARSRKQPVLGLILGSGLGAFADSFENAAVIPFSELPHFPSSKVAGHSGNLVIGNSEGVTVAALQGRVHLYEGYSAKEAAFPVRVLGSLGIRLLIVSNAAAGIHPDFHPGELMLITDHINLTGHNPLTGPNIDELGPRFPDMSEAYDASMREVAVEAARQKRIPLCQGVYIGLAGPSYETPAEIRMCRTLGADAAGMSTIAEVIAANHMGMRVLGISCITNAAAGILPGKLSHNGVLKTAELAEEKFQALLRGIISRAGELVRK